MSEANRTIRPSSLVTFQDCPRRYAARHMADLVASAGYELRGLLSTHVGAAVGSGVHAGAAYTLETKRTTGDLGNETEAEDRAVAEFEQRAEYGLDWDDTTSNGSTAKKQVARMTKAYRRHLAPQITPLLVERRLEGDVGDGWSVSGQLDTLEGDPDDVVRDLKTGTRQRANGAQYGAYAMLFTSHGFNVTGLAEDFLPRVRIDREQPPPVMTRIPLIPAMQDAWTIIEDIKRATAEFEARMADASSGRPPHTAFRPNPASALCADRWCPAWGTEFCKSHKRDQ